MARRLLLALDVLLLVLAAGLGLQLYRVWTEVPAERPARPPAPSASGPGAAAPPAAADASAPPPSVAIGPLSAYGQVAERNLFSPTRSEAPPEPTRPAVTAPAPPPGPKPRLYGVVLPASGGTARAYLEDPRTRKVFGYAVGDTVADSRVEQIRADRVVLRRGAEVFEVLLRDPTKPKPPPAPAPAPAAPVPATPRVPGRAAPAVPGQPAPGAPAFPFGPGATPPGTAAQPGVPEDNEEGAAPTVPPAPLFPGQPVMPPGVSGPVAPQVPGVAPRRPPVRIPTLPRSPGQSASPSAGAPGS
jgi:hypothetical protein